MDWLRRFAGRFRFPFRLHGLRLRVLRRFKSRKGYIRLVLAQPRRLVRGLRLGRILSRLRGLSLFGFVRAHDPGDLPHGRVVFGDGLHLAFRQLHAHHHQRDGPPRVLGNALVPEIRRRPVNEDAPVLGGKVLYYLPQQLPGLPVARLRRIVLVRQRLRPVELFRHGFQAAPQISLEESAGPLVHPGRAHIGRHVGDLAEARAHQRAVHARVDGPPDHIAYGFPLRVLRRKAQLFVFIPPGLIIAFVAHDHIVQKDIGGFGIEFLRKIDHRFPQHVLHPLREIPVSHAVQVLQEFFNAQALEQILRDARQRAADQNLRIVAAPVVDIQHGALRRAAAKDYTGDVRRAFRAPPQHAADLSGQEAVRAACEHAVGFIEQIHVAPEQVNDPIVIFHCPAPRGVRELSRKLPRGIIVQRLSRSKRLPQLLSVQVQRARAPDQGKRFRQHRGRRSAAPSTVHHVAHGFIQSLCPALVQGILHIFQIFQRLVVLPAVRQSIENALLVLRAVLRQLYRPGIVPFQRQILVGHRGAADDPIVPIQLPVPALEILLGLFILRIIAHRGHLGELRPFLHEIQVVLRLLFLACACRFLGVLPRALQRIPVTVQKILLFLRGRVCGIQAVHAAQVRRVFLAPSGQRFPFPGCQILREFAAHFLVDHVQGIAVHLGFLFRQAFRSSRSYFVENAVDVRESVCIPRQVPRMRLGEAVPRLSLQRLVRRFIRKIGALPDRVFRFLQLRPVFAVHGPVLICPSIRRAALHGFRALDRLHFPALFRLAAHGPAVVGEAVRIPVQRVVFFRFRFQRVGVRLLRSQRSGALDHVLLILLFDLAGCLIARPL